jgi:hypothetical protein
MAVIKRRSKMVSFRLSEQEYKDLLMLCEQRGSRSISDLARDAVFKLLVSGGPALSNGSGHSLEGSIIEHKVHDLDGRMQELDREVRRLADLLAERAIA